MLYDYDYSLRIDNTRHIKLISSQLSHSDKHPNWSVRHIHEGPNLQKYIDQAIERLGTEPTNTYNACFTVEGIMYEGYVLNSVNPQICYTFRPQASSARFISIYMLYTQGHESEGRGYFELDADSGLGGSDHRRELSQFPHQEKCVQCEGDKGVPYERAYGRTPTKIFETRICTDHYYRSTLETHPLFSHLKRSVTILPLKEYRKYKWLKHRIPNHMFKLEGFAHNLQ